MLWLRASQLHGISAHAAGLRGLSVPPGAYRSNLVGF